MTRWLLLLVVGLLCACGDSSNVNLAELCDTACLKAANCDGQSTAEPSCLSRCGADEGNALQAQCLANTSNCEDATWVACENLGGTICHRAVDKINACIAAGGSMSGPIGYQGWCSDQAQLGPTQTVAFKSWSETYLACKIDAATCRCPGQPFFDEL